MIEVEGLTRRYGDLTAVSGVGFSIEPGEVVGLLGHNGAGKTTIMKMLTGYLEPSSGRIEVGGLHIQTAKVRMCRIGTSCIKVGQHTRFIKLRMKQHRLNKHKLKHSGNKPCCEPGEKTCR